MNPLDSWREERRSGYLYRVLAEAEKGTPRETLFRQLGGEAEKQSRLWEERIRREGGSPPDGFVPDLRTKVVAALLRLFGPRPLRGVLTAMKVRGMSVYSSADPGHPMPTSASQTERTHRSLGGGGNLRAAVFGVNDGLVSNASLILGVAGAAGADSRAVLLSGAAGLMAGAFSMAAGEYLSVRSQREMYEHQIGLEKEELLQYPKEEAEELALIYSARGLSAEESRRLAEKVFSDPGQALETLSREELGLDPQQLGSPRAAALFSFFSFAAGAAIPLGPFFLSRGPEVLWVSIAVSALALAAAGAAISLFTGRGALWGGIRMLLIGGSAGAVTYLIGRALGVTLD